MQLFYHKIVVFGELITVQEQSEAPRLPTVLNT